MKKWLTKKNGIIVILLFIFCIGVITFEKSIYDVTIAIHTAEGTSNGPVIQIFWNDGSGYNAEQNALAEVVDCTGTLVLPKDEIGSIISYRLDPIHGEQDIIYKSIYVNNQEIPLADFLNCINGIVDAEVFYEETDDGEQLRFAIKGFDSQLHLNDTFKKTVLQASRMSNEQKLILILVGVILALISIFYQELKKAIRISTKWVEDRLERLAQIDSRWKLVFAILAIGFVSFIVMHQYIIGEKRFLFTDASDSYYQTYPELVNVVRCIEKGLVHNTYSFSKGLGQAQGVIKLNISNWVAWFGENALAYLMGVSHLLKIFLSGIFFYGFLRIKGTEHWYSVILALGYAFCGHMAVRASWSSYPNEVLLIAIWLFAFECWFQKKDFRWLPIATFLLFYHFGSGYYFILYMFFLPAYVLFRYFTERKIKAKVIGLSLTGIVIATIIYLYITGFSIMNQISEALQTDRAQIVLGETDWSISNFALNFDLLPRIFGRTIGLSVLGIIRNNYVEEYWNFLEDPTFFCGITVLLLIPLAFYLMDLKKKICYLLLYVAGVVYCLCEPLRIIINGFSGVTFKQSSFWIILVMLITVSQVDFRYIREKHIEKKCFVILSVTTILLFSTTSYLPKVIECSDFEWKLALGFILLEYISFTLYLLRSDTIYLMKSVLVLLVCIETICVSYPVYNNRSTADGSSYEDDTMLALEEIAEREGDSFYRIDKQYISVDSCDSLVQDYNGTAFYIGGTGIDSRVADFYNDLGLPIYAMNRRSWGISGYNDAQNVLGIKYALTDLDYVGHYGYTKVGQAGDISIYENEYAMPLGFVYQYAIERSTFEKLDYKQRQHVLLKACLVEDGNTILPIIDEESLTELKRSQQLFEQYEISYEAGKDNTFLFEPSTEEEVIAVQVTFEREGSAYLYYESEDGKEGTMRIQKENEVTGQIFEIAVSGINQIGFTSSGITDLHIAKIPKDEYYANFNEDMAKLQKSAVEVTYYTDNLIEGRFYTEEAGLLYLPIPNNSSWQIYVDDEKLNKQNINDAFIGVYVEVGEHMLRVTYPTGSFQNTYGDDIKWFLCCIMVIVIGSIWMHSKRKRGLKNERDISSSTSI